MLAEFAVVCLALVPNAMAKQISVTSGAAAHSNTSTSDVLTTIIYNAVICGGMVVAFLVLRLRFFRIYEPKSNYDIVPPHQKPKKLPRTPWGWILTVLTRPAKDTIREAGLDGYLFVRYLLVCAGLFGGGLLTWIVLLPANIVHGKGETGLDQMGISNVGSHRVYFAHTFMSWVFYGMTMFVIYRELTFYVNLRSAALVSPAYAGKLSARTVIFQTVSELYLDEAKISKLFDGVKRVWIARVERDLEKKVDRREKLCKKLEGAVCTLLNKAVQAKLKADKKGEAIEPADEIVCYVPPKKRPTMRLRPVFGKKVDVVEYCREEIPKLNEEIEQMQSNYKETAPINTVAVEFDTQFHAQTAFQQCAFDQPLRFTPREIGAEPQDLFWPNARMFWWERLARNLLGAVLVTLLVVFWAIPSAFVGMVSNLTYLTNMIHFLRFILQMPHLLLGLVTSLLPTILMTLLMMCLPPFIRLLAKISGCLTVQAITYYTQQSYFAFQVIQVFLVTTIASSITSVITQIMANPTSGLSLLSRNLPKSSNFFVSYVLFQGFTIAGGSLLQVVPLVLFYIKGRIFDHTPRAKWQRFNELGAYDWGTAFPVYTNLAVITLAYSIISPVILLFGAASFLILFICYQNNANYVVGQAPDAIGRYYARALFQTMVGVYLGEVCLAGIFLVSKAFVPAILELIGLLLTIFYHLHMNSAFDELLRVIPNTVMKPSDGHSDTISWSNPKTKETPLDDPAKASVPLLIDTQNGDEQELAKANPFIQFFLPSKYLSYTVVKKYIPETFYEMPNEPEEWVVHAYDYKVVSAKCPKVWIPRDPMGLSQGVIDKFKGIVDIVDANAEYDYKGRPVWTGPPPADEYALDDDDDDTDIKKSLEEGSYSAEKGSSIESIKKPSAKALSAGVWQEQTTRTVRTMTGSSEQTNPFDVPRLRK